MSSLLELAEIPFLDDPAGQTARVLSRLVAQTLARGAAILVGESGMLQVFSAVGMPVEQLAAAQTLFAASAERIAAGETLCAADHCLAPLLDKGELLGVLHVYGLPGDPAALDGYRMLLGAAVRASRQPGGLRSIDLLARTSASELQKHQLVATLDGNEWNISRVARILGVTRRTVYMRMKKFGVLRRRVRKGLDRATVPV